MINNSLFKIPEIPNFHPIAEMYERDEWFRLHKRKCIEGEWVGGKWMPGELYYYINFHTIIFEQGTYRGLGLPWLRDIDWEKAFVYAEACGFSGFEKDEEFSCHRGLSKDSDEYMDDELLLKLCTDTNTQQVNQFYLNNLYKKDGTRKIYIPARDYLQKIHKGNLGKPVYLNSAKHIIEMSSRGYGKEVPDYQLVETINGKVRIDSLVLGDKVLGRDGLETSVTGIFPQGEKDIYKFTFEDGREIECGLNHQWTMWKPSGVTVTVETKDILEKGVRCNPNKKTGELGPFKWYLPNINVIQYEEKELPVDPYILGALIGDGTLTNSTPKIVSDDEEILQEFRNRLPNFKLHRDNHTPNNYSISYQGSDKYKKEHKYGHNPLYNQLKKLNLNTTYYNKFIPEIYKYSAEHQRLELIRGLMDTDGCILNNGVIEFCNTSKQLVEDLAYILRSLGIRCSIGVSDRRGRIHKLPQGTLYTTINLMYRLYIRTDKPIFKLKRKLDKIKKRKQHDKVALVKVEKLGKTLQRCITVDNEEHLFLLENFVPTHNSYNSSGNIVHNFLFDGARDYDEYLQLKQNNNPLQSETIVGAIDAKYSNKLMDKVKTGIERLPGGKMITVNGEAVFYPSPLAVNYTGSFMVGREAIATNSKSKIGHVTFADNPFAASGGRPNKVFIDEVGFQNNILETWEAIENTQAVADFKRLTIHALGTGGLTSGGAVTYTQEILYNPEVYNCLAFEDKWENRGKIGYFVSGVMAMNKFKEGPNLITNEEKALEFILKEREKAKATKSPSKIQGTIINKPIVPSEIFLRMEGTFFPVHELKEALADLESNPILLKASYNVELVEKTKGVIKMIPSDKPVLTDYPLKKNQDMDACIQIFQKPKLDNDGHPFPGRYIMATDPVDDDGNDNILRSLQSTLILDTWTDDIVADYTARTYFADDYYENVRKLCVLYSAKNLYENNKKGLYAYFKNKNSLYYLADSPKILKDEELAKGEGIGNRSLGVNMTDKIKIFAAHAALKWLEEPSYHNPDKKRLYTIRTLGLLKELISYTKDVNADRVSALLILMIYRADLTLQIESRKEKNIKTTSQSNFWGNAYKRFNRDKVHNNMNNFVNKYTT